MKRLFLATMAAVLLAGCQPTNRFEVVAPDRAATSARLELCGRSPEAIPRVKDRFEIRIPADCRGSGRIVVVFVDGSTVECPIRFVAEDLDAWYRYLVTNGACRIH
jgi:hypothetical protein